MTAEEHEDSRTKNDSISEKSSDTLTENKVKKRRVRKKKPRKQNSEYDEESKDANEARENTDTTSVSEEVKVIKRRNEAVRSSGHGLDNGSCRRVSDHSENPDTAGQVEQMKYANRRNKGTRSSGPDVESAPSRRVDDGGEVPVAAGSVENVKNHVKRRNKVVGSYVPVDLENDLSRRIPNSDDTLELSRTAGQIKDVTSRDGNVRGEHPESSGTDKEAKDVKKVNKVFTERKANDFGKNSHPSEAVRVVKRRNKIVSSNRANEVGENPESSSLKEGVKDTERLEKVVDSRNIDDIGENPGTVKKVRVLKGGPSSRLVRNSVRLVLDQNNVRWDHVTPCSRNRQSQAHNRDDSLGENYVADVTQVGVTQRCNAEAGVTQRRKSFSNKVTKDSSGMERKENASRVEATEEYAKNRSPGNFTGDVPARGWEKLTRASAAIGNKPMKDHRRVYTTPRRRSLNQIFEKDFKGRDHLENQRPCPTDNRTKSDEPENPEHEPEEEETATHSAELSSSGKASCKVT